MTGSACGLYVHVPFCAARCTYCAFVTWTDRDEQQAAYFDALVTELRTRCEGRTFDTVYVGGGTPSRPEPAQLARVLDAVRSCATIAPGAEVTLEVNPESCDPARAAAWREAGFNRASMGVQSLDDAVLAAAGRLHSAERAIAAFGELRNAGFENLSVDLIAGLSDDDLTTLARTRRGLLALQPDHVSLYLLELDEAGKNSPLSAAVRAGRARVADDDELADAYEQSREDIERAGLPAYEISNFARSGRRSRHNMKYWRCDETLACGVAAHWFDGSRRRHDVTGFEAYLSLVESRGEAEAPESLAAPTVDVAQERMVLGLRLVEGVDLEDFGAADVARFRPVLEEHRSSGLVRAVSATRYALTLRGALLSNEVFADMVGA